jgi:hypothetical protein
MFLLYGDIVYFLCTSVLFRASLEPWLLHGQLLLVSVERVLALLLHEFSDRRHTTQAIRH